jgi:lysine N6-hydroxylase
MAAAREPRCGVPAQRVSEAPLDLTGVGIGPCNLSLAALAHGLRGPRTAFYERRPDFHWHPGLLIDGATLQVPFLADLVTMADPASPWSFLSYLKARERLFPFYFAERFHIERAEYDAYCRWVSEGLRASGEAAADGDGGSRQAAAGYTRLHFGHQVDAVRWRPERELFEVDFTQLGEGGEAVALGRSYARNLVLGVGSEPRVPAALRPLVDAVDAPVIHSADYLAHRERLLAAEHVTVVGSGQSGAEVFLDLLRGREAGREGLHWLTRSPAFAPMEYSKLGLEHFTPDYTRYFQRLPERVRDRLVPAQWQLHKAVGHGTLGAIHDELYRRTLAGGWPDAVLTPGVLVRSAGRMGASKAGTARVELRLAHVEQGGHTRVTTDFVVLATGYGERSLDGLLAALSPYIHRDASGRIRIDERYRMVLDPSVRGAVYVQNAERHTHGVGAPDLGLAAHRSAVILNALVGEERYRLPARTAFTTFGFRRPERQEPGAGPGGGAGAGADGTGGSVRRPMGAT